MGGKGTDRMTNEEKIEKAFYDASPKPEPITSPCPCGGMRTLGACWKCDSCLCDPSDPNPDIVLEELKYVIDAINYKGAMWQVEEMDQAYMLYHGDRNVSNFYDKEHDDANNIARTMNAMEKIKRIIFAASAR